MPQVHHFNTFQMRNAATRLGREHSIFKYSRNARRRNTSNDAERGIVDEPGVIHRNTAPGGISDERISRSTSKEADRLGSSDQTQSTMVDSQATTSDTVNGDLRQRKTSTDDIPTHENGETSSRANTGSATSDKEPGKFTVGNQLERTLLNSWINILLLAIPAGFAVNYAGIDGKIVFTINFIAIIPLAAMLSFATEEIAHRTGETLGGLINATFGNAVELIVAVLALVKGNVRVVQTSLIGSILSNLLLVLGMCFFFGGMHRKVQYFNKTVAQTAASLLALAVASNIVPTVFKAHAATDTSQNDVIDAANVASISRGVSVILLVVYGAYLFFQLKTHSKVFNEPSQKVEKQEWSHKPKKGIKQLGRTSLAVGAASGSQPKDERGEQILAHIHTHEDSQHEDEAPAEPELHILVAIATLAISTVLIAFCAEFMVDGISTITQDGVSVEFVGLILLPIVGNAAEHVTAVTVATKDKMDLAIGVAVGSSMQVSLFLIPLLVIIGWGLGNEDMSLAFDNFQIAVLFVSVLLVNYLIADGESHWLEGFLLMCLYVIIAVCSWWYPVSGDVVG